MKQPVRILVSTVACAALLSACARNINSSVYTDNAMAGKVLEGKIISMRAVTIKAHDKLEDNKMGGLVGAGAGGLAGSQVGGGNGSIAAAIGGAVIGAVAGAFAQDALSTSHGTEYLVKIDKKYLREYRTLSKKIQSNGKSTVEQDFTGSTNISTQTNIISVVQAADAALHKGSHVYIIYSDDRPRLEAED